MDHLESMNSPPTERKLTYIQEHPEDIGSLGYSGVLCLVSSTLGRIQRSWLRRSLQSDERLPWHSGSKFSSIHSILLTCESFFTMTLSGLDQGLEGTLSDAMTRDVLDRTLGSLCFSQAVYFLSQCLLHHPFLLRHHLQSAKVPIPPSFLRHALMTCRENAASLSRLLQSLLKWRICISGFMGYCAVVAGVTHRLFEYDDDPSVRESSKALYQASLDFLNQAPGRWRHYPRMVSPLFPFFWPGAGFFSPSWPWKMMDDFTNACLGFIFRPWHYLPSSLTRTLQLQ